MVRRSAVAALLVCVVVAGCNRVDEARLSAELQQLARSTPSFLERGERGRPLWKQAGGFYKDRAFRPAWIDAGKPTPPLETLLQSIRAAEKHGLDPQDYDLDALLRARRLADEGGWFGARFDEKGIPQLDARLTYAYLQLATDLEKGRVAAKRVDSNWIAARKDEDLIARLRDALAHNTIAASLETLAPTHQQYKGLQQALLKYEQAARETNAPPEERTRAAWRLEQIRMTMERWRWMPHDLGDRYILINVPAYQLQVIEHDRPVLGMRVVVGSPENRTPLFSDLMTYVVFSPYWNIPDKIIREETLPRVAQDPDFLNRTGIEIVRAVGREEEPVDPTTIDWTQPDVVADLKFRQVPGPENALGLVKFIFPNHFSVYLHDTPADALFKRPARALSHGCVRVERPVTLAEYVLQDQRAWTPERIAAAMHAGQEQVVRLKTPIPVHLGYWTAWAQADGSVLFTDDPYGLDGRHAQVRRARDQQALR